MCLQTRFQILDCVQWIQRHSFQRIAIQFSPDDLPDSPQICQQLKQETSVENEFFIVLTASCGVDFLAPLRLGTGYIQAIIAFGSNAGSPCLAPDTPFADLPVLFVFGDRYDEESYEYTKRQVQQLMSEDEILFYDLKHAALVERLVREKVLDNSKVAKITLSTDKWTFSGNISTLTAPKTGVKEVGHFACPVDVINCKSVLWIGTCDDLYFKTCGWNISGIDPDSKSEWRSVSQKELTKRLAQIERAKTAKTIGIVFTNTLPSVDQTLRRVKQLIKKQGKSMILISVVQSADNTKFGNFSEVDVYALSSSCTCGSLILKTKTHVPLISLTELEIALGVKKMFGGLEWNSDSDPLDQEDDEDKDPAASESGNEIRDILEFKDSMRSNWFGLEVAAGEHAIAVAEDGSTGIASGYASEPK